MLALANLIIERLEQGHIISDAHGFHHYLRDHIIPPMAEEIVKIRENYGWKRGKK